MCLDTKYTEKEKQTYLKRYTKKGWLRVWKAVCVNTITKTYKSMWGNEYKQGLNTDEKRKRLYISRGYYQTGYHCETTKRGGESWIWYSKKLIACYVKPEWVKTMGTQHGNKVIVSRQAVFPAYGRIEPYKKDLRAAGIKV